jgi:hypothetical protein
MVVMHRAMLCQLQNNRAEGLFATLGMRQIHPQCLAPMSCLSEREPFPSSEGRQEECGMAIEGISASLEITQESSAPRVDASGVSSAISHLNCRNQAITPTTNRSLPRTASRWVVSNRDVTPAKSGWGPQTEGRLPTERGPRAKKWPVGGNASRL